MALALFGSLCFSAGVAVCIAIDAWLWRNTPNKPPTYTRPE